MFVRGRERREHAKEQEEELLIDSVRLTSGDEDVVRDAFIATDEFNAGKF